MSYDRDSPFKKAAHRTIEFPNQFLQTYRRVRPMPAAGSHLQHPQSLHFPNSVNQQSILMFF